MRKHFPRATCAVSGLVPAIALLSIPAYAQEPVPPADVPAAQPVVTASAPAAQGPTASDRANYDASLRAATGQATADSAATQETPVTATSRPTARATVSAPVPAARANPARPTARVAAPAEPPSAPIASAPPAVPEVPQSTPAVTDGVIPPPNFAETPAAVTASGNAEPAAAAQAAMSPLNWVLVGLAALAALAIGFFAVRRRRASDEDIWVDSRGEEAPIAAFRDPADRVEAADLSVPAGDDIDVLTAATAPVAGRPWIELALRPVRAAADDESTRVDLELTLANAGEDVARDVRVNTFMLSDAADAASDMETLLAQGHAAAPVAAGTIGAGEGSRLDTTLSAPAAGERFNPIVVADVRYTLPDGGEGRTAASFVIGEAQGEMLMPINADGLPHEDVAAALHGEPERV